LVVPGITMDTSTRVTEPCSFHHLQKKLGIVLHESDGQSPKRALAVIGIPTDSISRITEPCSFHHLQKEGFDHVTQVVLLVPTDTIQTLQISEPMVLVLLGIPTDFVSRVTENCSYFRR
jgi:hypothetical protein